MNGYIHATTQFWGPPQDTRLDTQAHTTRHWELSELDRYCFDCPLPDCDQMDPRCPFNDDHSSAKRVYDLAYKATKREVDEAVAWIVAERERT